MRKAQPCAGLVRVAGWGIRFHGMRTNREFGGVSALHAPGPREQRRLGFLKGQIRVPRDFDRMGSAEIEKMFGDGD